MGKEIADYMFQRLKENYDELTRKNNRKQKLEIEIAELKEKVELYRNEFSAALKKFDLEPDNYDLDDIGSSQIQFQRRWKRKTLADFAHKILIEAKSPMHIRDIANILIQKGQMRHDVHRPEAVINTALRRRADLFVSLGSGKWATNDITSDEEPSENSIELESLDINLDENNDNEE